MREFTDDTEALFDRTLFGRQRSAAQSARAKAKRRKTSVDYKAKESERSRKRSRSRWSQRKEDIAILDFETEPFDNIRETRVEPFLAVLWRPDGHEVIWDENLPALLNKVVSAIKALPRCYTVYAHNGGKFDWMFIFHLLRGRLQFKGRSLMEARLGRHILRDSFHILPEALSAMQKDNFDYAWMKKGIRLKKRQQIIDYAISDCAYLYRFVKAFIDRFGFKMSIGQAAMSEIKRAGYTYDKLSVADDELLRAFYFGGRVDCLRGSGHFTGNFKLYDVNSMYPYVMANFKHPVGLPSEIRGCSGGPDIGVTDRTYFLEVTCHNDGAYLYRDTAGDFGEAGNVTADLRFGTFFVSIWEYRMAERLGLMRHPVVHRTIEFDKITNFAEFVLPIYRDRQLFKEDVKRLEKAGRKGSEEWIEAKTQDSLAKFLLNNGYGKFSQNPRNFKEYLAIGHGEWAPNVREGEEPWTLEFESHGERETDFFALYTRPISRSRWKQALNNVAAGASITGAARAVLLEGLASSARPIYCDTDSIICEDLHGVPIHSTDLGAWDCEAEFDEIIIIGRKTYACRRNGKLLEDVGSVKERDRLLREGLALEKIKSKGTTGLTWKDFQDMLAGTPVSKKNKAPTIRRDGSQFYMDRTTQITARAPSFKIGRAA